MYVIFRTSQFKRDVKKARKKHNDINHLKPVISKLAQGVAPSAKHKDHRLKGALKDCRECHIESDWLLIYRIQGNELHLIRTGSHSDLFR